MTVAFQVELTAAPDDDRPTVMIVVGAAGEGGFADNFARQAAQWEKISQQAGARSIVLAPGGAASPASDYEQLKQALAAEPKEGAGELWLVLIGHGTFDGKEAKFNLRGPDLPAADLALWLQPFRRPLAVIDTSSSSAPFLNKLSGPNRVIVTATRSGYEQNFTRFGQYFAEALGDPQSDLDKDGQISLLEAFLGAAYRVTEFYKTEGRLATEHALIDDNGDGLGTPADWFRGLTATKQARDGASLDGTRAHQFHLVRSEAEQKLSPAQRQRRDELELAVAKLRAAKQKLPPDDYYRQLEALLMELAKLYQQSS
jgi:hypothetical protein